MAERPTRNGEPDMPKWQITVTLAEDEPSEVLDHVIDLFGDVNASVEKVDA